MIDWLSPLFFHLCDRHRRKPAIPRRSLLCEPLEKRQVPAQVLDISSLFTAASDHVTASLVSGALEAGNGTTTDAIVARGTDTFLANDTTPGNDTIDLSALTSGQYGASSILGARATTAWSAAPATRSSVTTAATTPS
jgi:hypothetical protein